MGSGKGARPPSHVAYYVALVGILSLLLMLCCYFCFYFINRVKELSHQESPTQTPSTPRPKPTATAYPIQPDIRDSATAMAKLCKQLPAQPSGKGDTVFPTSTSPEAHQTDTGDTGDAVPDKVPAPAVAVNVEACEVR